MVDLTIVALDLSLTSTGVALWCDPHDHTTTVWCVSATGPARLYQLRQKVREVALNPAMPADLVVLEGYSFNSKYHRAEAIGELGGVVRLELWERGIPYVEVPPAVLKKYATGRGNASKRDLFGAAVHRFGRQFETDDEADARWLLDMALAHYGLPHVPVPKAQAAVLNKVAWPSLASVGVYS